MTDEPELFSGHDGEWVGYLRELLRHHGYEQVAATGAFDDPLADAVRAFQEVRGIPADGVVRADTWACLTGDPVEPTYPAAGSDDPVEEIDPVEYPALAAVLEHAASGRLEEYLALIDAR